MGWYACAAWQLFSDDGTEIEEGDSVSEITYKTEEGPETIKDATVDDITETTVTVMHGKEDTETTIDVDDIIEIEKD